MRLWSFNPQYLDSTGLSRTINESIAGYKALRKTGEGYPKAWEKHPQLERFKGREKELRNFIWFLLEEHVERKQKEINWDIWLDSETTPITKTMTVTEGQLKYEWKHYLNKLSKRNLELYEKYKDIETPKTNPLFKTVPGSIESWEKVK
jgi:hypothetical protein